MTSSPPSLIYSLNGLEERLKAHTRVFNQLLETIPPKFYLADVNEKLSANDYQKRKKSKEAAKNAKKAKLDPANQQSVLQIQEELLRKEELELAKSKKNAGKQKRTTKSAQQTGGATVEDNAQDDDSDVMMEDADGAHMNGFAALADRDDYDSLDDDDEALPVFAAGSIHEEESDEWVSDEDGGNGDETKRKRRSESTSTAKKPAAAQKRAAKSPKTPKTAAIATEDDGDFESPAPFRSAGATTSSPGPASIDALRERLQARIGALRQKRNVADEEKSTEDVQSEAKKLSAKERREEKQRLREERKQRKKEKEKEKQLAQQHSEDDGSAEDNQVSSKSKEADVKMDTDFEFAKFQFDGEKKRHLTRPEHMLQKLEKRKEKLSTLKQTDEAKATQWEEEEQWHRAVRLARGDKVRDDEQLLRKAIKRTADKKKRSERAWNERLRIVREQMEQRQKKRNDNLQSRIDAKKNKIMGKKAPKKTPAGKKGKGASGGKAKGGKKPKQRPGFEGATKKSKPKSK
ncbi:surfeit locus protein 6-domain-containing protein [Thamnocephalis sphaerospora]|uniref:Surfeit locus protein 6-domain-containing protein n=1 Tax=Thamnocephalis sphaerospora TaxID=78915 RepID=A0A4P9XQV8_9FUNG|nr:surfeit locus protein 6-domain-containing protein [Thamnocephalis sphaerospora]|eukprot:RKP08436.1 surfeit locus protein 6-domain-containing protein [Thamnocephalis sphaerospora]